MPGNRIKVLYILGAGRSGSTLLANILGQIDGFQNIGEPYYLWDQILSPNGMCGCGKLVRECPFWSQILMRSIGSLEASKLLRISKSGQKISKTRHIPLLATRIGSRHLEAKSAEFIKTLTRVYQGVWEVSGCEVIIDASKFPSYGLILKNIAAIDLYVLHLVRDPRAVAYSWQRKKYNPGTKKLFGRMSPLRSGAIWLSWNLAGELLKTSQNEDRYRRVRYEDLITAPNPVLNKILTFLGEGGVLPFIDSHQVSLEPNHSIAGNPLRFHQGGITLKPDNEWINNLNFRTRFLTTHLTWPLLIRYDYPLLVTKSP